MLTNNAENIVTLLADSFHSIGYKRSLIKKDYGFTDFYIPDAPTRHIPLGVFGQKPLNYRSACFGIYFADQDQYPDTFLQNFRAFGAPLIFLIRNGKTEAWSITQAQPALIEECKTSLLPDKILSRKKEWNPDEMIRAKTGFKHPGARQLDFVDIGLLPALDKQASQKIDTLIKDILHFTEKEFLRRKESFKAQHVFRILFHLLTAKLIKDCEIPNAGRIDFTMPVPTLDFVSRRYGNGEQKALQHFPGDLLSDISRRIGSSFSLKNISVDTLTYIYENTFVTTQNREQLGIHSTPSYVADYVLSQLPIEDIPRSKWSFLDPMCGHGIFLISAMRRMRDLLPKDWGGRRRHEFFLHALHGVEIDAFSVEVARMCLMLADFPETNGWDLINKDVFSGTVLETQISKSSVLIGNPPFEAMKTAGPKLPKPVHLLRRALESLPDEGLVGLVLPRAFLDGSDYRRERETILVNYEILSLTALPDKIFRYSDAETVIFIARKQKSSGNTFTLYREVKDHHKEAFRSSYAITWEDKVQQNYFSGRQENRLSVPMLFELWERLSDFPRLEEIAEIKIGVQYEPDAAKNCFNKVISSNFFPGSKPGIDKVTNKFLAFEATDTIYLTTDTLYRRKRALGSWELDWSTPKVIVPASRTSRGPWHHVAAIDKEGRLVSRRFYAVWPKEKIIGVELLAVLLNSPVAEAFTFAHSSQRDIPARVYKSIPVPPNISDVNLSIKALVDQYLGVVQTDHHKAREVLFKIDAEILKLYDLPPRMERQLLDIFWGARRRVPFVFEGYIPPEKASFIPLHIYISQQYKDAMSRKIIERIPAKPDHEMAKYIKGVWERTP